MLRDMLGLIKGGRRGSSSWPKHEGWYGCTISLMKIMAWNVRGLGRQERRCRVRNVIKERRVDVMLIQKTKRSSVDKQFVKSIWPWDRMAFIAVDADGSSGGLLSIWNPDMFIMSECCGNRNFLAISGTTLGSFDCVLINLYARMM